MGVLSYKASARLNKGKPLANLANTTIDVGSVAPSVHLPASTGGDIALEDYRGRANVVLFFVRAYT